MSGSDLGLETVVLGLRKDSTVLTFLMVLTLGMVMTLVVVMARAESSQAPAPVQNNGGIRMRR